MESAVRTMNSQPRAIISFTSKSCALVFIAIFLSRLFFLMSAGGSVPFWDQWGGENSIFSAFESGSLTLAQMFAPHNEHRIFWTRLLTIILFELNGHQWDNQVEAFASNFIYSISLTIPVLITSIKSHKNQAISVAVAVTLMGILPFGWENTLVGFQSQFYINTLLAFIAIAVSSFGAIKLRTAITLTILILASLASMANGVLTAFACAGVLIARGANQRDLQSRRDACCICHAAWNRWLHHHPFPSVPRTVEGPGYLRSGFRITDNKQLATLARNRPISFICSSCILDADSRTQSPDSN